MPNVYRTPVTDEDVAAVLAPLKPYSTHEAAKLYASYAQNMEASGRPVATRTMFGKALGRCGCRRRVVRRGRGKRGHQVRADIPMFDLPGTDPVLAPQDEITALVRAMGAGFHPLGEVYRHYLRMGVSNPVTRASLMFQLGRRGYPEIRDKGRACRYFHLPKES